MCRATRSHSRVPKFTSCCFIKQTLLSLSNRNLYFYAFVFCDSNVLNNSSL